MADVTSKGCDQIALKCSLIRAFACYKCNILKPQDVAQIVKLSLFTLRYAGWRTREKERLDRRYKGVYKTYLREFSDLGIDEETLKKARKKHAASKESSVTQKDADERTEAENTKADAEDETDAHVDLLDFSRLKLNQKRRFSVATTSAQYVPADMVRRRSTGNALPLEVLENLRRSSLPLLHEDTPLTDGDIAKAASSSSITDTSEQATNTTDEITPYDGDESHDKGRRGRRASLAVTSDLAGSKELQNIVNPGRRGRRASLAVTSNVSTSGDTQPLNLPGRRGRRGSVTLTAETSSIQTPQGARLSRRSSIPNIEIPTMYGN